MIERLAGPRRLEQSYALFTAALVIVVVGTTMLLTHSRVHDVLRAALETRAASLAHSVGAGLVPALAVGDSTAIQHAVERAVEDPDIRYVIVHDDASRVGGHAGAGFEEGVPSMPRSFEVAALRTIELPDSGASIEASLPLRQSSGALLGVVRVGLSCDPIDRRLAEIRRWLFVLGAALTGFALLLSHVAARRVTVPLHQLAQSTEALAWGDTSRRVAARGSQELVDLAQAFNRMLDRVEEQAHQSAEYQQALAKLNATLEEQVLERTRALEESVRQYRTLVDESPDAILIWQCGRLRFVNRAFVESFGIEEEEALAADFELERILPGEAAEHFRESVESWQREREAAPCALGGVAADGGALQLELRGSRIDYRGAPAVECLLVDTTEARRLRERLEDSQRLRSLGELAGGVAHDFNNLLGAILGRVQLIRKGTPDAELDRDLAVIEKAAQNGRETVRRIQAFSRRDADSPLEPTDLRAVLADAIEMTRTRWKTEAERRNVAIRMETELPEVSPILGHASELCEVFTNLILNAVDAMPQGGRLAVSLSECDDEVRVVVADDGVGMTEEIRRHLFDPFFTTKGVAGTGLGMSVAYGIVARHEGTIEVESERGEGSRFVLSFAARPELSIEPTVVAAPHADGRGKRILVIDDEPPIAQLLEDVLSSTGHAVDVAGCGRDGVRMAGQTDYDLVLTDLGMPDMSGWEVAERILRDAPELPVVLVTGWAATVSESEVAGSGVAAVVHKPFEIDELLGTTAAILDKRGRGRG